MADIITPPLVMTLVQAHGTIRAHLQVRSLKELVVLVALVLNGTIPCHILNLPPPQELLARALEELHVPYPKLALRVASNSFSPALKLLLIKRNPQTRPQAPVGHQNANKNPDSSRIPRTGPSLRRRRQRLDSPHHHGAFIWKDGTGDEGYRFARVDENPQIGLPIDSTETLFDEGHKESTTGWKDISLPSEKADGGSDGDTKVGKAAPTKSSVSNPQQELQLLCTFQNASCVHIQLDCTRLNSDRDFFLHIKKSLPRPPGFMPFWALKVCRVKYVKFSSHSSVAEILKHDDVPPDDQQAAYRPCHSEFLQRPRPNSSTLLHFLEHPSHASDTFEGFSRVPMRISVKKSLEPRTSSEYMIGWGLEIQQGPNVVRLTLAVAIMLIVSSLNIRLWAFWTACQTLGIGDYVLAVTLSCALTPGIVATCSLLYSRPLSSSLWQHIKSLVVSWGGILLISGRSVAKQCRHRSYKCACGQVVSLPRYGDTTVTGESNKLGCAIGQVASAATTCPSADQGGTGTPSSWASFLSLKGAPKTRNGQPDLESRPNCHSPTDCTIKTTERHKDDKKDHPHFLICAYTDRDSLPRPYSLCADAIENDEGFFRNLRGLRRPKRTSLCRPWTWLRSVTAINYVEFEVLRDGRVSILRRPGFAPTYRSTEYRPVFDRTGPVDQCIHPIPSSHLIDHYYDPVGAGTGTVYMDRLTQKTRGRLDAGDVSRTAYGIELEEGISWCKVRWIGYMWASFCLMGGILWGRFRDVQTAFTIAPCLMMLGAFVLNLSTGAFERLTPVYEA